MVQEKNPKKTSIVDKHMFIPFLFYATTILMIVGYQDPNVGVVTQLITTTIVIFLSLIIFSRYACYRHPTPKPLTKSLGSIYDSINSWKYNPFNQPRKKPEKGFVTRLVMIILFIITPMASIPFLIEGKWAESGVFSSRQIAVNEYGNEYFAEEDGEIIVKPRIELNTVKKISIIIGMELNLALLRMCFTPEFDTQAREYIKNINSTIIVNNQTFSTHGELREDCISIDREQLEFQYNWKMSYQIPFEDTPINADGIPLFNDKPSLKKVFKLEYVNFSIVSFILLISWWALVVLFLRVFKYIWRGFE